MAAIGRLVKALDLSVSIESEQRRFVTRIMASLLNRLPRTRRDEEWLREVCYELGADYGELYRRFNPHGFVLRDGPDIPHPGALAEGTFEGTLRLLTALYAVWQGRGLAAAAIDNAVNAALERSAVDLGVRWQTGSFQRSGARELDAALLEQAAEWLETWPAERQSFNKAMSALLEHHYDEVARNCYVAVEGMARVIVGNDKTLDGNREALVSAVDLSAEWKQVLRGYLEYVHTARHAHAERHAMKEHEAEACLYLTGTVLRLVSMRL